MNFRDSLRVSRPLKNGRHDFQQSTKKTGRIVNLFCGLNTPRAKCCTAIIEVSQAAMNLLGRLTTEVTEEKTERRTILKKLEFLSSIRELGVLRGEQSEFFGCGSGSAIIET
jgi:hypothetical protein